MEHGKNVRSPSLMSGTDYIMKTWGKTHAYEQVHFVHFDRGRNQTFKQPNVQLKDMLPTDFYVFKDTNGAHFRGKMLHNYLVRENTESRITFSLLADTALTSATVEAPAAPAVETVEQPEANVTSEVETVEQVASEGSDESTDVAAEVEIETVDETVEQVAEAAPAVESALDRKRRLDRERKAEKRRAAKAQLEALVSTPVGDVAQVAA